jgi:hypothetical protein
MLRMISLRTLSIAGIYELFSDMDSNINSNWSIQVYTIGPNMICKKRAIMVQHRLQRRVLT